MDVDELLQKAKELQKRIDQYSSTGHDSDPGRAAQAQVCQFFREYAGPQSSFLKQAEEAEGHASYLVPTLVQIVQSFIEYLEAGLTTGHSPRRQGQLDAVSDFLEQAHVMLENKSFHPAGAAVLTGAALEEFLRTWVEAEGVAMGSSKPSIDAYAKALRGAELISKQDIKDITSWAGIRNHAAHGEWDDVSDRARVRLMLEGINLFMRQYST